MRRPRANVVCGLLQWIDGPMKGGVSYYLPFFAIITLESVADLLEQRDKSPFLQIPKRPKDFSSAQGSSRFLP